MSILTPDRLPAVQQASQQVIETFRAASDAFLRARTDLLALETRTTVQTLSHNATLVPANSTAAITFTHTLGRVPIAAPRCADASITVYLSNVTTTQIVVRARNHSGGDITPTVAVEFI